MRTFVPATVVSGAALFFAMPVFATEATTVYRVQTPGCTIEMQIGSSKRYSGTPVFFYPEEIGLQKQCLSETGDLDSGNCVKRFVGAVAVVRFYAKRGDAECSAMREYVRVIDQDSESKHLPPYERTISLGTGTGSDIQLFGFDQRALVTGGELPPSWRLFRQELFLDQTTKPFLIVHWKHTLTSIGLMDVIPVGTTQLQEHAPRRARKR